MTTKPKKEKIKVGNKIIEIFEYMTVIPLAFILACIAWIAVLIISPFWLVKELNK